jgi:hypothetical protein
VPASIMVDDVLLKVDDDDQESMDLLMGLLF